MSNLSYFGVTHVELRSLWTCPWKGGPNGGGNALQTGGDRPLGRGTGLATSSLTGPCAAGPANSSTGSVSAGWAALPPTVFLGPPMSKAKAPCFAPCGSSDAVFFASSGVAGSASLAFSPVVPASFLPPLRFRPWSEDGGPHQCNAASKDGLSRQRRSNSADDWGTSSVEAKTDEVGRTDHCEAQSDRSVGHDRNTASGSVGMAMAFCFF